MIEPHTVHRHFYISSEEIAELLGYPNARVVKIERSADRSGDWLVVTSENP